MRLSLLIGPNCTAAHLAQEGCLEELCRPVGSDSSGDAAGRHDWAHIFISVLPALPSLRLAASVAASPSLLLTQQADGSGAEGAANARIASALKVGAIVWTTRAQVVRLFCSLINCPPPAPSPQAAFAVLVSKHLVQLRIAAVAQVGGGGHT